MEIQYIGKGIEINDNLKNFMEKKLNKIAKLDQILDITVTLAQEKYRYVADFLIHTRNNTWNIKEESSDIKLSIQQAINKLQRQIAKQRDKVVDRKRRAKDSINSWQVSILSFEESEPKPIILKENRFEIKLMSLEEAYDQLITLKNDFVIFRDANNNRISVLYRRKDGNFGLILPETD